MKYKKWINISLVVMFIVFIGFSSLIDYPKGKESGQAFLNVLIEMLKILPCAFILIGLFEVWVKKETVMKHLGQNSGFKGYFWILLLAGFSVGGLFVAFPVAETLYKKGASLKVIFTYLGFSGVFRIPLTIFEISFLGLPFTITRLLAAAPLLLVIGIIMGTILEKKGYKLNLRNRS